MLGKITKIEELHDLRIEPVAKVYGENGRQLGFAQTLRSAFGGYEEMDGYKVETDSHTFRVLIDNGQSCCESWGYLSSEDDLNRFIGSTLLEVNLTDKALNVRRVEESDYYEDEGGIQFVDFVTDQGTFQLAVYNGHNGYYGHGILVAKDDEIILNDTL